jgi:hypothetical protein
LAGGSWNSSTLKRACRTRQAPDVLLGTLHASLRARRLLGVREDARMTNGLRKGKQQQKLLETPWHSSSCCSYSPQTPSSTKEVARSFGSWPLFLQ